MTNNKTYINCSICKSEIEDKHSHNAEPVNNGKCCQECNDLWVIIARLFLSRKR